MSKSKKTRLPPLTLSREDILANHSPSQVANVVKKIRDTSGQTCLELSKNVNRLGSLEKTLVGILNSVSTPYYRTWRVKVTPLGRLVFQLRASAPTIKEKESGLWLTPSATTISTRSKESMEKRKKYRESIGRTTVPPGNLAEQVQHGHKATHMWRTPDNMAGGSNLPGIQRALDQGHLKRPSGQPIQIRLMDQVREPRLWEKVPTPTARDYKDAGPNSNYEKMKQKGRLAGTAGGSLNPTWVEWLMGYPEGWTDLKD